MKQPPPNTRQNFSSSDKTRIIFVILFLGILLVIFGILLGLILKQNGFRFSIQDLLTRPLSTNAPVSILPAGNTPSVSIPMPECGTPTLVIGSVPFQIQTIQAAPDGILPVPADGFGIAYWVNGTNTNYVFALSPTQANYSLISTLPTGTTARVTWPDCSSTIYLLSAPEQGFFSATTLPDQSFAGILIFFQLDPIGNGYGLKGSLRTEQTLENTAPSPAPEFALPLAVENTLPPSVEILPSPIVINTIPPTGGDFPSSSGEILAEIALLEAALSPDGTTIKIGVSIYNWGQSAFNLSMGDVSLTQQDGTILVMLSSEPKLPIKISPTATEMFSFTFPRPTGPTPTLKIFSVEYDIDEY